MTAVAVGVGVWRLELDDGWQAATSVTESRIAVVARAGTCLI